MIRDVLVEIGGIGMLGILSLLLFFTVFAVAMFRAIRLNHPFVETMKQLPLDDGNTIRKPAGDESHD